MSAIFGFFSSKNLVSAEKLQTMSTVLSHRGKDDVGFYGVKENNGKSYSGSDSAKEIRENLPQLCNEDFFSLGLGARRLASKDLSVKSHQPFIYDEFVLTVDGELYNYNELKSELKHLGYNFETEGYEEIFAKSYKEWGKDALLKFDGIFLACIYNTTTSELIIFRDRLGMKPIFYTVENEIFYWASEIKGILSAKDEKPRVDWNGLFSNLRFQTSVYPRTCFEGIKSIPPGSFLTIKKDATAVEISQYWRIPTKTDENLSEDEVIDKLEKLLHQSIDQRLDADIPILSTMSGGIDSTLMTAIVKDKKELDSFCVSYREGNEETSNAKVAKEFFKIKHDIIPINSISEGLYDSIAHCEEPNVGIETMHDAGKYAATTGYKIILSGNGADDAFGGGSHVLKLSRWKKMRQLRLLNQFLPNKEGFINRLKNQLTLTDIADFFVQGQSGMTQKDLIYLFGERAKDFKIDIERSGNNNYQSYFNLEVKYNIGCHHTYRDDLSAMKHGVFFRYPYLSNDLIDFIAKVPEKYRFNGKMNKPLLVKLAQKYVPESILRAPKRGFSSSLQSWMQEDIELKELFETQLDKLMARNIVNNKTLIKWRETKKNDVDYARLWQMMTFEIWLQKYFDQVGAEINPY